MIQQTAEQRIKDMEALLQEVIAENEALEIALKRLQRNRKNLQNLTRYYRSEYWISDRKHSSGELVLTEDAIYAEIQRRDRLEDDITIELKQQMRALDDTLE